MLQFLNYRQYTVDSCFCMHTATLFVHPILQERQNFRKLAAELFETITLETRLGDALERLKGSKPYQLVYLSTQFDRHLSEKWLESAKISPQGRQAAYVAVVNRSSSKYPLRSFRPPVDGFDLLLEEPYSLENLKESVQQSKRVIEARKREAEISALKSLIKKLPNLIDLRTESYLLGKEAPNVDKMLKQAKATIASLSPDMKAVYMDELVNIFENAQPNILEKQPQSERLPIHRGISIQNRVVNKYR